MNETETAQKTAVPGTVMIIGAAGRMGSITVKTAAAHGIKTVPIDPKNPDFPKMPQVTEEISAIIDFSLPTATEETLEYAKKRKIPAVIAATGHTEREYLNILKAAEIIPVFRAVNLSPGMEIIRRALSLAAGNLPGSRHFGDRDTREKQARQAERQCNNALRHGESRPGKRIRRVVDPVRECSRHPRGQDLHRMRHDNPHPRGLRQNRVRRGRTESRGIPCRQKTGSVRHG